MASGSWSLQLGEAGGCVLSVEIFIGNRNYELVYTAPSHPMHALGRVGLGFRLGGRAGAGTGTGGRDRGLEHF